MMNKAILIAISNKETFMIGKLYQILGVLKDTPSEAEIIHAFRLRQLSPDYADPNKQWVINRAFSVLSDRNRRKNYDEFVERYERDANELFCQPKNTIFYLNLSFALSSNPRDEKYIKFLLEEFTVDEAAIRENKSIIFNCFRGLTDREWLNQVILTSGCYPFLKIDMLSELGAALNSVNLDEICAQGMWNLFYAKYYLEAIVACIRCLRTDILLAKGYYAPEYIISSAHADYLYFEWVKAIDTNENFQQLLEVFNFLVMKGLIPNYTIFRQAVISQGLNNNLNHLKILLLYRNTNPFVSLAQCRELLRELIASVLQPQTLGVFSVLMSVPNIVTEKILDAALDNISKNGKYFFQAYGKFLNLLSVDIIRVLHNKINRDKYRQANELQDLKDAVRKELNSRVAGAKSQELTIPRSTISNPSVVSNAQGSFWYHATSARTSEQATSPTIIVKPQPIPQPQTSRRMQISFIIN